MPILNQARAVAVALCAACAAAGCGPSRSVNTRLYGPGRQPRVHTEPMTVAAVPPGAFGDVYLAGTPDGVQGAFLDDHPGATVTTVEPYLDGTGAMVYRVTYVEGGSAGRSVYLSDGSAAFDAGEGQTHAAPRDAIEDARRQAARALIPATRPAAPREAR